MHTPPVTNLLLKAALDRFPAERSLLLRLVVADETFRSVCEDYAVATERLSNLRGAGAMADAAEVADYVTLVAELEVELANLVDRARCSASP